MSITYKKLWKLLIDRDMKKDLCQKANISNATLIKMKNNVFVTTDVLAKIYSALEYDMADIVEFINDEKTNFGGKDE